MAFGPGLSGATPYSMAKISGNAGVPLSGRVDGFVYRQTSVGVVVARRPRKDPYKPRGKKTSDAQLTTRTQFAQASQYAKKVLKDPLARRAYQRFAKVRNRRFDRVPVSDYLTPPEIEEIDLSAYQGRPRDVIRVLAFDDVQVVSVEVEIHTAAGVLVEKGEAKAAHDVWTYVASAAADLSTPLVITITAVDRPDNRTTKKVVYP
jgi:hypothetical protein